MPVAVSPERALIPRAHSRTSDPENSRHGFFIHRYRKRAKPMTLQRRLQEESMSYQTLLDSTRHELARQYPAEDLHTLTDAADLPGYVDSSNFFRACKRWFGVPPAQYRASLG